MKRRNKTKNFQCTSVSIKVDTIELTDVEKAYAMNIFKSEIDRVVFMKMKTKMFA